MILNNTDDIYSIQEKLSRVEAFNGKGLIGQNIKIKSKIRDI